MNTELAPMTPELTEHWKYRYPSLALRVRDGNDKCIAYWLKMQDMPEETFKAASVKLDTALEKLRDMCLLLETMEEEFEGEGICLYIMNKKKIKQCVTGIFDPSGQTPDKVSQCFVCPSAHPWWRE
jgi:hypothetical protein